MDLTKKHSDLKFDVNATDNEGRTAGMYLAIKGSYYISLNNTKGDYALYKSTIDDENSTFLNLRNYGFKMNYTNEENESVLSLALDHMYETTDL